MREQRLNLVGVLSLLAIFIGVLFEQGQFDWLLGVALVLVVLIVANLLGELALRTEVICMCAIALVTLVTLLYWI